MLDKEIIDKLSKIVGVDNTLTSDVELFTYSYDASFLPLLPAKKPDVVLKARSTEQVSRIMELAYAYGLPVVPRGLGSGRTGGSVPLERAYGQSEHSGGCRISENYDR